MKNFDAIVIGTGQSGPSLASRLANAGYQVAVIEKGKFGGTCVNTGCTPTKTLVASAKAAHMARRAADFGVEIKGEISVDMKKVKERKDGIVSKSNTGVENWMKNTKNITVFEGHGKFESNNTVSVNGESLTADKIFINVGGRPFVPEGFRDIPHLTSDSIMDVDFVPENLIVVGGSYIGLEFGQIFNRFGSNVTIIEKGDRLVRREDQETSEAITKILEAENIKFRFNAECLMGSIKDGQIEVQVDCKEGNTKEYATHVLVATGRTPNTNDLGLENTDIKTNSRGYIQVDDQCRTNVSGVWAIGDCNGQGAFTHTSYNDFEIVAANLLDNDPRRISDRIPCYGLFIDPALARIGMTEDQVRASGISALKGYRPMTKVSRAKEKGETFGFMKVLVDARTERILGATILGIEGDEIIHGMLDLMYADKPYTVISRAVHIHPTISELIPTMLQGLRPLE